MKYECEVIQDLLPLYVDDICSGKSKAMVNEHLDECKNCKQQLYALRNNLVTQELVAERNRVLIHHEKKEKKRSTLIGVITAGILMIPLIVCLICNLAVGHALDWFYIVLTSLMVFASLTVVPLLVTDNKLMWSLGAMTVSLTVLLGTICILTGGTWFFLAVVPTVAGLLICFMPYIICHVPLPESLKTSKALITLVVDTLAVYAIIFVVGATVWVPNYWSISLPITAFCLLYPWGVLLLARYLKLNVYFRGAGITVFTVLFLVVVNDVIDVVLGIFDKFSLQKANFLYWNSESIDGNISWILVAIGLLLTIIFIINGIAEEGNKTS